MAVTLVPIVGRPLLHQEGETASARPGRASNQIAHVRDEDDVRDVTSSEADRERLLDIGRQYREWGPVDAMSRWAPLLCRLPGPADLHAVEVRESKSDDDETHGGKLYLMFAKHRQAYQDLEQREVPQDQVIVKQSWLPEETDETSPDDILKLLEDLRERGFPTTHQLEIDGTMTDQPVAPLAYRDGVAFAPNEPGPLYVMYRADGEAVNSDEGWLYGVLSGDGQEVLQAGKLQVCIDCHVEAGKDRLFGLPRLFSSKQTPPTSVDGVGK